MSDDLVLKTLLELKEDLGEVRGSVDGLVKSVSTHMVDDKTFHERTSKRLGALERRNSYERGILVTVSVVASFCVQYVARKLGFSTPGG